MLYHSHLYAVDGDVHHFIEASMSHSSDIPLFLAAVSWSALGACAVEATLHHFDIAAGARKAIFWLAYGLYAFGVVGTVFSISDIHGPAWYVSLVLHAILTGLPLAICHVRLSRLRRDREAGHG